ncbi:NOT2 family protein [Penicillium chermesinum]|nr:NOT2 family protein [Penicillium chermesinum]
MSGFPAQQPQAQTRNGALPSARMPNGKLGGAANWNFNLPGTSALPNTQQRNMGTMGSFAQSLGGSQSGTPLDLRYVKCHRPSGQSGHALPTYVGGYGNLELMWTVFVQ